jgi:hypothetical protein
MTRYQLVGVWLVITGLIAVIVAWVRGRFV